MKETNSAQNALVGAAFAALLSWPATASDDDFAAIRNAASAPIVGQDAATSRGQSRQTILIGRRYAPYFSNHSLTVGNRDLTRAIIVIHGSGRDAADYFDAVVDSLPAGSNPTGDWRSKTIVIAPHFQEKEDARDDEMWWQGDWNRGGERKDVSSFAVVDTMVELLRGGNFPKLKWIVITGHSAGGQFVQRYAAFTDIDLRPGPNSTAVKFVPANPSSYVYLNEYRFDKDLNAWVIPRGKKNKDYDDYKYGLDDLEDYAGDRGPAWARTHLPTRWVEVLAGTADIEATSSFDDSREAMWQGDSRYERALLFGAFMDRFFPRNRLTVTPVHGVGHDHRQIYASEEARRALFFPD